jgi:hypothetical protein
LALQWTFLEQKILAISERFLWTNTSLPQNIMRLNRDWKDLPVGRDGDGRAFAAVGLGQAHAAREAAAHAAVCFFADDKTIGAGPAGSFEFACRAIFHTT